MWPWGHAAVAYLFVTVFARFDRRRPTEREVLAVFLASQLPDVVDKPLAWTLGVLPNGRSLAHSLVIASLVILVVVAVARTRDRPAIGAAVGIGYLSHLVADALYPAVTGKYAELGFLGWPIVPPVEYPTDKSFLTHITSFEVTWFTALQFVLVAVAVAIWLQHERPGLALLARRAGIVEQ